MTTIYILNVIFAFISTFINLSRGAMFSNGNIKGLFVILHWIALIILIVFSVIYGSWINIITMLIVNLVASRIFSYIIIKFIYKSDMKDFK